MSETTDRAQRLAQARSLVQQLEAGDDQEAARIIDQLARSRDDDLYCEVGRLARNVHDSIEAFLCDSGIPEITEKEIPDASERLSYVIRMTENSANTTLGAIEVSLPLVDELGNRSDHLSNEWQRFHERELSVNEFRRLAQELDTFFEIVTEHSSQLHGRLSEVLLAQDFQDLTGQIIRKVIVLIHEVEEKLVQLIRLSGSKGPIRSKPSDEKKDDLKAHGPVVPGVDQGNLVSGQDEVDDLLSSLGF